MWRLIISTVSATCTEAVPVQESLWKFMRTTAAATSRGSAAKIIMLFLLALLLWRVLTPQSTPMGLHLIFLDLLLASHSTSLLWSPFRHTRNRGGLYFLSFGNPLYLSLYDSGWLVRMHEKRKGKRFNLLLYWISESGIRLSLFDLLGF